MLDYARLSADYASYHLTEGSQRAHMAGMPLIGPAFVAGKLFGS